MLVIASYPRSGNHLARFVIEYLTGRPTLGCITNAKDVPICENRFRDQPDVLAHVGGEPIGAKVHSVGEIGRWPDERLPLTGIVFIQRNPIEAILSHLAKTDGWGLAQLKREARSYFRLASHVRRTDLPKVRLSYEKLISSDSRIYLAEIDALAAFLGSAVIPARLASLRGDFPRLRAVNATATGRDWAGVNSGGRARFYASTSPFTVRTLAALFIILRRVTPRHRNGDAFARVAKRSAQRLA